MGPGQRSGNTTSLPYVLAIRTSALAELAVVVWPVTEAHPKSGSCSDALDRRAPKQVAPLALPRGAAAHLLLC